MLSRETLIKLILVEHKTLEQAAEELGTHKNTVWRALKSFEIDPRDWWKYQVLTCDKCGATIDPEVKLGEQRRKNLIRKGPRYCDDCKVEVNRERNRTKQAAWRAKNKQHYNEYVRDWRKKNPERWAEIKRRSESKKKGGVDSGGHSS